ncbi:MAG: carbohydrate porin [Planctomycetota bacterium]
MVAAGITVLSLGLVARGDDDPIAGVGDAFDAAELVPAATSGIPPVLPGQEAGARASGATPAAAAESAREWFGHAPIWTWSRFTGDWAGARTPLEESGFEFDGSLTSEWSQVVSGGLAEKSAFRFLLDLNLTVDLGVLAGLEGASAFADFQTADTGVGGRDDGAFQSPSNIAVDGSITQLSQLWYEQWFLDRGLRVKAGKVDANSEFAFIEAAAGFINASAGFTPTIVGFPTYPDPATGINLFVYPNERSYLGAGFYDGAGADGVRTGASGPSTFFSDDRSDAWFLVAEAGLTGDGWRAAIGGWWHTGDFDTFAGGTDDGTAGAYALVEARVWSPDADAGSERGIRVFGQFGIADEAVSPAAAQYGAGVVFAGLVPGRADDAFGIYATLCDMSDDPAAGFGSDEFVVELYYEAAVTPWLTLKPDLQWISNPSGDASIDDAFVATFRCTIAF